MTYMFICAGRLIRPVLCSTSPHRLSGWRDVILGWNTKIKKQKVGVSSGRSLDSDKCSEFGSVFFKLLFIGCWFIRKPGVLHCPCRLAVVKLIHPPWEQTSHFSSLLFHLTFSLTLLIKVVRHPDCWQISFMRWEKMNIRYMIHPLVCRMKGKKNVYKKTDQHQHVKLFWCNYAFKQNLNPLQENSIFLQQNRLQHNRQQTAKENRQ